MLIFLSNVFCGTQCTIQKIQREPYEKQPQLPSLISNQEKLNIVQALRVPTLGSLLNQNT